MVASLGIVAPSIHYHDGTFYIATSKMEIVDDKFNWVSFIISTRDIWSDSWSDPVVFDWNGIDVSLFFEDGQTFVQGSWALDLTKQPASSIYQVAIDINTGKWLGEAKEIWAGWAKHDTEGPHLYKVGEYYYLIAAEGGTFEHHMLSVARSKDKWGPYEAWENNPILTSDGKDEEIQNVGHGAFFQDNDQRWWAAVLGVRRQENGTLGLGRETFLTPVDWPEGGWPTVRQPKPSFSRESMASPKNTRSIAVPDRVEDVFIRDHCHSCYGYEDDGKTIVLTPTLAGFAEQVETCTFLGRRQRGITSTATAALDAGTAQLSGKQVTAGLALYKDALRFAYVAYDVDNNSVVFRIQNSAKGIRGMVDRKLQCRPSELVFRICATALRCSFEVAVESAETVGEEERGWLEVGNISTEYLHARDYTGPLYGVFAHTLDVSGTDARVVLRDFEIKDGI